jgi:hypothetical protein
MLEGLSQQLLVSTLLSMLGLGTEACHGCHHQWFQLC